MCNTSIRLIQVCQEDKDNAYRSYAKVSDFYVFLCVQQQVHALNIAVQDASTVHVLQSKCSLHTISSHGQAGFGLLGWLQAKVGK